MKGIHKREPNLRLPDLPPGVTEITVGVGDNIFVLHSRKPWTEVMDRCGKDFSDSKPIGGPAVPSKFAPLLPGRRTKAAPRAMPYKD